MNAVTKFWQSSDVLKSMTERALGRSVTTFASKSLAGGFCSAVYLIEADGRKMVLKIASEDSVSVMRHEKDYVPIEAKMMKLFNEKLTILMPELLYYDDSREICSVPYFFMSYLEGKPLAEQEGLSENEWQEIKRQVGKITRAICDIPAPTFGIPALPESYCKRNSDFVYRLMEMLLQDAAEKNIAIPGISAEELLGMITARRNVLDEVTDPCYIHTDTWDGNVMVEKGKFTGLVDYAAILYGDPLMSHDFHDFAPEPVPAFMEGYGKKGLTEGEWERIKVYRLWHRLGMIVEKGYRQYEDANLYNWVEGEFIKCVEDLKNARH